MTNLMRMLCHRAHKSISKELFADVLVTKIINLHFKSLNKKKQAGQEKWSIT